MHSRIRTLQQIPNASSRGVGNAVRLFLCLAQFCRVPDVKEETVDPEQEKQGREFPQPRLLLEAHQMRRQVEHETESENESNDLKARQMPLPWRKQPAGKRKFAH